MNEQIQLGDTVEYEGHHWQVTGGGRLGVWNQLFLHRVAQYATTAMYGEVRLIKAEVGGKNVYKLIYGNEACELDTEYYASEQDAIEVARAWVEKTRPEGNTHPLVQEPPDEKYGYVDIVIGGGAHGMETAWARVEPLKIHTTPHRWWEE